MSEKTEAVSSLRIQLLGPFRIEVDGVPLVSHHWPRRKAKLLVKMLALQPDHQLHREQLMEMLWPESDPQLAAQNLHRIIYIARRVLEPQLSSGPGSARARSSFLVTRGQQVSLSAPELLWVDTEEFEKCSTEALKSSDVELYLRALKLYRGDLLIEERYEDWTIGPRDRLRARFKDLLLKLAHLYEARGEHQHAIEQLVRLVEHDPTDEATHRQLMRLYALTGHKFQALEQYKQCREILWREIEEEPETETKKLGRQILLGTLRPLPQFDTEQAAQLRTGEGERESSALSSGLPKSVKAVNGEPYSLAVLPFFSKEAAPSSEYLTGTLTEGIINVLSSFEDLRVVEHSDVLAYRSLDLSAQEAARRLEVKAVMVGYLQGLANQVTIKTEIIKALDGTRIWEAVYTMKSAELLKIKDQITVDIKAWLNSSLSSP